MKMCNTFDHNFKNIPLYIMRKVSLERYYFVLYDCALTSEMSKMALKSFCDKTSSYPSLSMENGNQESYLVQNHTIKLSLSQSI